MKTANITDTMSHIRSIKNVAQTKLETLKQCKELMLNVVERANPELNLDSTWLNARTFAQFVDALETLHESVSDQWQVIREARREARNQAVKELKQCTKLKLASGLIVQVVYVNTGNCTFAAKVIDEDSLTHDVGDIIHCSALTLSKATVLEEPRESRLTYARMGINEFAYHTAKKGFTVYVSETDKFCYGFFSGGDFKRVVYFQYDPFAGIQFSGCYKPSNQSGTGWRICESTVLDLSRDQLAGLLSSNAPSWANKNPVYTTMEQMLDKRFSDYNKITVSTSL